MNAADILFFLLLLLGGVTGYYAGAIRMVAEIIKWMACFLAGIWWYRFISAGIGLTNINNGVLQLLIFLSGLLFFFFLTSLIQQFILKITGNRINRAFFNKIAGILPGTAAGALIGLLVIQGFRYSGDDYYSQLGKKSMVESFINSDNLFTADKYSNPARQALLSFAPREMVAGEKRKVPVNDNVNSYTSRPDLEYKMLLLVNDERRKLGLEALKADEEMRKVGRSHATDMLARNYFSHSTPEGLDPFARMKAAGIRYFFAGENLASAPTLELAHQGLMHSPPHRAAILNADFKRVGIAVIDGGPKGLMIAQEFRD